MVSVKANQVAALIEKLPALYGKFDTENPLNYGFVDERINLQYQNEQRALSIVLHFCVLSVIITFLGLFGPATFVAEKWIFAGTAILSILISRLTVSFQALIVALPDPVESLRSE